MAKSKKKTEYYIEPKVFKESLRKYYDSDILTDDLAENSICDVNNVKPFYKMGEWDGKLSNGNKAPFGAYVYEINYKKLKDSKTKILNGTITLIR